MNKKTAIAIFILVLIFSGGGFLLWQNSKAAVKDLNATLPEGVRVVKSLFGNEYRVVNKIDGYEFKVPKMIGKTWLISYDDFAENKYWHIPLVSNELRKLVEKETALIVFGWKGEVSDFKIERFAFKEDVSLEKFVENLKSTATSDFFDSFQIKLNIIQDDSIINGRSLIKLKVSPDSNQNILDMPDYLYIFKGQSNIYILFLPEDDDPTQQFTKKVISSGKW